MTGPERTDPLHRVVHQSDHIPGGNDDFAAQSGREIIAYATIGQSP
jgi:hypothetical protein